MLTYAQIAQEVKAAYAGPPTVRTADDDVVAVVKQTDNEFLVAVPGTTDAGGWMRDLTAWPAYFPALGWTHEGFGSGGVDLWKEVSLLLPANSRVIFAGHSLGGALAQCLAVQYATQRPDASFEVVVFGSPRVALTTNLFFHAAIRKALDVRLFARIGDPVIDIPFAPLYWHAVKPSEIGMGAALSMANHSIGLYARDLYRAEHL
jgi:pimeloyl-ACP methyl ester carboxylesterase